MGVLIGFFLGEFERRFSFARLRVLNGKLKDREYLLVNRKITIGKAAGSSIVIKAYKIMPTASITGIRDEIFFETSQDELCLLNDRKTSGRHALKYHDVIRLGDLKLLYLPL